MTLQSPLNAFHQLCDDAKSSHQRRLLVIHQPREQGRELFESLFHAEQETMDGFWVGDQPLLGWPALPASKCRQLLGRELGVVVIDGFDGLDPDALAAVSGAVRGGGLLVLLIPPLAQWPEFDDPDYRRLLVHPFTVEQQSHRFLQWLKQAIERASGALLMGDQVQFQPVAEVDGEALDVCAISSPTQRDCITLDQQLAVEAVMRVAKGHRRRPLVMTADRGRGKSTALGIAAAHLLRSGMSDILLTAPRLESVKPVFEHAARILGLDYHNQTLLESSQGRLRFVPPDRIARHEVAADLLLVDEAAAIPTSMLEQFLQRYSRCVFASTVHGYEGTGRGFALQFRKTLDSATPQWRSLELQQPIRWAPHDPVEAFLYDALLLDAAMAPPASFGSVDFTATTVECVARDRLLADPTLLREIFSLLVLAHYQTSPADLRNLLDGPNVEVWVTRLAGKVVATALVTVEGNFDSEMAAAVWKGERRLRGHLIPQTLSAHAGVAEAVHLSYLRVMRIAVHPSLQGQGLGLQLLDNVVDDAERRNVDIVGSSFGLTADVLPFWQRGGFLPVRLGVSRDSCSGTHSALVLLPLSTAGAQLADRVRLRFLDQFPYQLGNTFKALEPELVAGLMLGSDHYEGIGLDAQDWLDVQAFARGYRVLDVCTVALWRLVCCYLGHIDVQELLSQQQRDILIRLLLQGWTVSQTCQHYGLSGKKALVKELRQAVDILSRQRLRLVSQLLH